MANAPAVSSPIAPRTLAYTVLVIALISAAIALILMRMALNTGIPSPVIVAIRMTIAIAVFLPLALRSHPQAIRQFSRKDWILLPLAGLLFAGDLTLFSESIKHTSILLATVIGGLSPLWTALLERAVLKAPLSRMVYLGLTLALGGGVVIALAGSGNSTGLGPNPLLGGLLALGSGLSAACYLIVARSLRPRIPLTPYISVVFAFALIVVLIVTFSSGLSFTGYPPGGIIWVLLATLTGQLIAHPSFGFVVGYLSPTFISISAQSITVAASIMAFLFFAETPGTGELIGSAIILVGVIFAITGQSEIKRA